MAAVSPTELRRHERSHIAEGRHMYSEDQGSSIESADNAFDDMKQLIGDEDLSDKQNSLPMACFNFINSIIGSGVIGIPYALHEAGILLGLFLLVLVAVVTDYSLIIMVRSAHLCGKYSYQGIMESAFGRPGYYLLGSLQFMYPFIAMVSYNVVVGDTVTKVVIHLFDLGPESLWGKRQFIVFLCTVFITVPLCLYRDISKLARISFLSLLCVLFILFSIFIRMGSMQDIVPEKGDSWQLYNTDIIPAIGIMAFAFMCHHNTFLIFTSIQEPTQAKWDKVTHASLLTSFIVALLFGIAGYSTFTSYSQGDLLENYCWDDTLMNFSRILFSATILLTYPIECFVTREVIEHTFFHNDPNVPISMYRHYAVTMVVITLTYIISISTDCLGVVMELNGVLAAVPLAYVLPAMVYLKVEEGNILSRPKIPALGLLIFGLTVAVFGVIFLMFDFNKVNTCSLGEIIEYCRNANISHASINPTMAPAYHLNAVARI